MTSRDFYFAARSLSKSSIVIMVCICINLFGIIASQLTKSILFVDLAGTAVASLVYGPLHGALVGLFSNWLGEFMVGPALAPSFGITLQYYFLFSPVHMISALIWSVAPRLLRGRLATDLFCDDESQYPSGKLLLGFVGLAFLSNIMSAFVIAMIVVSYGPFMGCSAAGSAVVRGDTVLCDLAGLIFGQTGATPLEEFIYLAAAKMAIGFPDHLISLSIAVLVVSFVLNGRRYKMNGAFGRTIVTNRPSVAAVYFVLMTAMMFVFVFHAYREFGAACAFGSLFVCLLFVLGVAGLIVCGAFRVFLFIEDGNHREHIFSGLNRDMKDAFEDSMKLAVLFSVVLYFWLEWLRLSTAAPAAVFFQNKLFGALGVAFLITFVRYVFLVSARVARYLRKFVRDDSADRDALTDEVGW